MGSTSSKCRIANDSNELTTQWWPVSLLFLSGCSVALHIGKVPAALPGLREQMQLTLTQSGLVVSLYSLMIAILGVLLGMLVKRCGYVAFAIAGLSLVSVGSFAGSLSLTLHGLLLTRVLEGFGWIMAAIAFPPILTSLTAAHDRPLVLGIWGGFVPLGAGFMLLLSPWLQQWGGWQLSWQVASALSFLALLIVWKVLRNKQSLMQLLHMGDSVVSIGTLKNPMAWLFGLCFLFYSLQYIGVTSFMPTLFVETTSWSLASTSRLVAFVVLCSVLGNAAAGYLLRRRVSNVFLLIAGAIGMGVSAMVVFTESFGIPARIVAAFMFTTLGGIIPGTLFASVANATNNPMAIGLLIGLMLQLAGVGQLLGGVLLPAVVEYFHSWQAAGVLCVLLALAGCATAALIPRYQGTRGS